MSVLVENYEQTHKYRSDNYRNTVFAPRVNKVDSHLKVYVEPRDEC